MDINLIQELRRGTYEEIQYHRGGLRLLPGPFSPHPTPLPSTKRQDVGQAVGGGHPCIYQKSGRQADRRAASEGSLLVTVADKTNTERRRRRVLKRRRE